MAPQSQPFRPSRARRLARWIGRNWARISYARKIEPTWLEVTRLDIALANLPAGLHGFRIAHLSDFHAGRSVPLTHLERAVDLANEHEPDLVALTGDFVHAGSQYLEVICRTLSRLRSRHGVFAVLGNHDFAVRNALALRSSRRLATRVESGLRSAGITVLRNQSLTITANGQQMRIIGVDDLWSRTWDLEAAFAHSSRETPTVLLAHNPRITEHLNGRRCDLILSGHTHGGQINWPGLGPFLLSRRAKRLAAGLYDHHGTWVYVNRGVGHGFRFRFGARPEVAILRLHSPPE